MSYQTLIRELDPTVNPAGVEGFMRNAHGTLDHLSRAGFQEYATFARTCEKAAPSHLRACAESHGFLADFERWEATS